MKQTKKVKKAWQLCYTVMEWSGDYGTRQVEWAYLLNQETAEVKKVQVSVTFTPPKKSK